MPTKRSLRRGIMAACGFPLWVVACIACSASGDSGADATAGGGRTGAAGGGGLAGLGEGGRAGVPSLDSVCAQKTFGGERNAGSLLLLVDISGSMAVDEKWTHTQAALSTMIQEAPAALEAGIAFFPKPGTKGCTGVMEQPGVPVAPLSSTRSKLLSALGLQKPDGGTPTYQALLAAYKAVREHETDGKRYVLLITDGDPDARTNEAPAAFTPECGWWQDMWAAAKKERLGSPSVGTYVVGSPGVTKFDFLSRLAVEGGTRRTPTCIEDASCGLAGDCCHHQIGALDFEKELREVLVEISGQIAGCTFSLPAGDEVDPDKLNVIVRSGGKEDTLGRDASHGKGWDYTDGSHSAVELYGEDCERVKQDPVAEVVILLGCPTVIY